MMNSFCTYYDHRYLPRGLALYRSLRAQVPELRMWVACMDDACHRVLTELALPGLHPIALEELEEGDDELLRAKSNRSTVEYYFTCTPSIPRFIFKRWPQVEAVTYVDADLYFYADPKPLFDELGEGSIAIVPHRFPAHMRYLEQAGIYNVGWLTFRRDERARACLEWWRERCLEWCYDSYEDGKFADQKYLDDWPERFEGVQVIQHKGANLAPWNLSNYRVRRDGQRVLVDEDPLIFYHFHGLRRHWGPLYDMYLAAYEATGNRVVTRKLYVPYLQQLLDIGEEIKPMLPPRPVDRGVREASGKTRAQRPLVHWIKRPLAFLLGLVRGNFLVVIGRRVI